MTAIGIDTGSTSTDAVIYDLEQHSILSYAKAMTTHENLETGIREALPGVTIRQAPDGAVFEGLSSLFEKQ